MTETHRTRELYERGKARIPMGTQLLSKRPESFLPGGWPAYFRRARGVEVEDLDGRVYVDVSIFSVGACPLGYGDPEVDEAVLGAVRAGNMSTLNAPEEVWLAEKLCALHPWAEMVRYPRTGGEAMAAAVRIARAHTGKERVAFSGYHGWHDWYLAANLGDPAALDGHLLPQIPPAGVPRGLAELTLPFGFGDLAALQALFARYGASFAAIVLEPARYSVLSPDFLSAVRALASEHGAVLVLDEITAGFRMNLGGLHRTLGVEPDVAVFSKGMSNGYPMAAVLGRGEIMRAAERTFISSTYWTDRIGPAAALATIGKMEREPVHAHIQAMGRRMREGWARLAAQHGLPLQTKGIEALPSFSIPAGEDTRALATLYTQLMLDQGFLASGAFYPSYAHTEDHVDRALAASERAFATMAEALGAGDVRGRLRGPVSESGLRRG